MIHRFPQSQVSFNSSVVLFPSQAARLSRSCGCPNNFIVDMATVVTCCSPNDFTVFTVIATSPLSLWQVSLPAIFQHFHCHHAYCLTKCSQCYLSKCTGVPPDDIMSSVSTSNNYSIYCFYCHRHAVFTCSGSDLSIVTMSTVFTYCSPKHFHCHNVYHVYLL